MSTGIAWTLDMSKPRPHVFWSYAKPFTTGSLSTCSTAASIAAVSSGCCTTVVCTEAVSEASSRSTRGAASVEVTLVQTSSPANNPTTYGACVRGHGACYDAVGKTVADVRRRTSRHRVK